MPRSFIYSIWFSLIIAFAISALIFILCRNFFEINDAIVISVCSTIIIFLMTQKIATDKEVKKEKKEDKAEIIEYVDKQDRVIIAQLNQHIEESDRVNEAMTKLIGSIDRKLNILIAREK